MEKYCPFCGEKVGNVMSVTTKEGIVAHLECVCSRLDSGERLTEESINRILNSPQTKLDQCIRNIEGEKLNVINNLDAFGKVLQTLSSILVSFGVEYSLEEYKMVNEAYATIDEAIRKITKLELLTDLKSENRKNRVIKKIDKDKEAIEALRNAEVNY